MLVVRAEIWPGGDQSCAWPVGEIVAANESNLAPVSAYSVSICQEPASLIGIEGWEREFTLDGHHRSEGVWGLVAAILEQALPAESRNDCRADREDSSHGEG